MSTHGKQIELHGVGKRYGDVTAVSRLDLVIERGSFVSLLGPSGCGKTTTLRMIAGLETPSSGDILVDGQRINETPVHRRNFGLVFQNHALFPHKSAFDNVAFGLKQRKTPKAEIERRVAEALALVRLPNVGDRLPSQLSGGQQQRIAVARAVVIEPDLLLFDEPLSALDAGLREEMRIELKRIQHTLGITTVFVTHDQSEALAMSDKIVVMNQGRIEQQGAPRDIYRNPRSAFVAGFFGQLNSFEGRIVDTRPDHSVAELTGGAKVRLLGSHPRGDTIALTLRADCAQVDARPARADKNSVDTIPAVVRTSDYLGQMVRYSVSIGDRDVVVVQPDDSGLFQPGDKVRLRVAPESWMIL
jgi:putative spermidine/putrescine transport system ATP-binding protein